MIAKNNQVKMENPKPLIRFLNFKAMIKERIEKMMERIMERKSNKRTVAASGVDIAPNASIGMPTPIIKLNDKEDAIPR